MLIDQHHQMKNHTYILVIYYHVYHHQIVYYYVVTQVIMVQQSILNQKIYYGIHQHARLILLRVLQQMICYLVTPKSEWK